MPDNTTGQITPFNLRQTALDMIASYPNMNAGSYVQLSNGGLGGDQSAATVGQIPVYPGSGGAAVPTSTAIFYTTAKCDNSTNDVAAINTAITAANTAGGGIVQLPKSTSACIIGGSSIVLKSNVYLKGAGRGATTLKLLASYASNAIIGSSVSFFGVSDLTIDAGGYTPAGSIAITIANDDTDGFVQRVEIKNMGQYGIAYQGGQRLLIADNTISAATSSATQNEGIIGFGGLANYNIRILRNSLTNTGMDLDDAYTVIADNYITTWNYGSGITIEQSANSHSYEIIGNTLISGGGNNSGIETWAMDSRVVNNYVEGNAGTGMDIGGQRTVVQGNYTIDNTTGGSGSGIVARYADSTYNASGSIFADNHSYNTAGAGGPQLYGYAEQSSSLSNIQLVGNNFNTNATGPTNILSSTTTNGITSGDSGTVTNTMLAGGITGGNLSLTSAHLFVGNGSSVGADVAASGDVTLANTGAFTVAKVNGVTLGTTAPGISSCGTGLPALTTGSNNLAGQFITGTGTPTACTITFATGAPFANYAFCTISPANAAAEGIVGGEYISSSSKTAFTVTLAAGTSSAAFNYVCNGH
jgi:hypothetical protein